MNWLRLILFGTVLLTPPVLAIASLTEAVIRCGRRQDTLAETRSQVQRLVDLKASAPDVAIPDVDDAQLVAGVRAGLRRAGVPDASIRDIATRRDPSRGFGATPTNSVETTLSSCSLPQLGSVIRQMIDGASDPNTQVFILQSITMSRPSNAQAGKEGFLVTLLLSPAARREISP